MKHTKFLIIILILLSTLLIGCSNSDAESQEVVDLDSVKIEQDVANSDVVLNDASFEAKKETISTFSSPTEKTSQTSKDGSKVETSYDGAGNKIERRYFFNHQNLESLTITTTPKGVKEATVFGHNRENKTLSADLVDVALTAPADDIARSAGIKTTKIQSPTNFTVVKNGQQNPVAPPVNYPTTTQPMPQPQRVQTVETSPQTVEQEPTEKPAIAQSQGNNQAEN